MKHRCPPTLRGLPLAIGLACLSMADAATAQDPARESARQHRQPAVELDTLEVREQRSRDQKAQDDVYDKNISHLHVDRQTLDRYRGVSTGDVFAGMNGVYNTDNRNGSALFPNIRGLSGNGRIPVTVDGTVQSLDVWMAMRGVNNRNYLDPNLFRSIEIEKGPSMSRGIKSGIGGSVAIRTIEAEDLISPGGNWGIELKTGAGSNSVKSTFGPASIVGKDYRDVPGAITAVPFNQTGVAFTKPMIPTRDRGDVSRYNLHDHRLFLATGYRNTMFDVMAAYSDSQRGNYFAGKHGAGDYLYNGSEEGMGIRSSARNLYPDIARLFAPRYEVPFTHSNAESLLLKNNWYLPGQQKLSFGYTHNQLDFGELPAASLEALFGMLNEDKLLNFARGAFGYPFPATVIDQDVYRIGYEAKPAGSAWLDLEMSAWRTLTRSTRYQTGDTTYLTKGKDLDWDRWVECHSRVYAGDEVCALMIEYGVIPPATTPPERLPNIDGRYNIFIGTRHDTRATRNGFDLSNRFRLGERLLLTATVDWQREGQHDHVPVEVASMAGGLTTLFFGPASGRRQECGTRLNLDWKASDRLQVAAGIRYGRYSSFDEETEHRRAAQHWGWRDDRRNVSQRLEWSEIISDEAAEAFHHLANSKPEWTKDPDTGEWYMKPPLYNLTSEQAEDYQQVITDFRKSVDCGFGCTISPDPVNGLYYYLRPGTDDNRKASGIKVPLHGRKANRDENPFHTGEIDALEMVLDPHGKRGLYPRYRPLVPDIYQLVSVKNEDIWRRPEEQRLGAWSSQLAVSYRLFDRARAYVRLGSAARFPSLLESVNRRGRAGSFDFDLRRPERNLAWEVGYAHDLGGLLPWLQRADLKLSYYHNSISNFFDRTMDMATIQFDRKVMSGLELQSRFDTGHLHGSLGISRRLEQKMCDKDYAVMLDPFYGRLPECLTGGFPGSLSWFSLQPRTSLNLDLGTRMLDGRLELGTRLRYHSSTENRQLDRLLANDADWRAKGYSYRLGTVLLQGSATPYSWEPVRLIDLYAEYHFNPHASARLSVDNLTDRYYMDPLGKVATPGPGRTVMLDIAFKL